MRIKVPHLPRVRFPRRRARRRSADAGTPGPLRTGILRVPRRIPLALVAALVEALVAAASLVSFAESYRGLYLWAHCHGLAGLWPLQVDVFIAVGELALFVGPQRLPPQVPQPAHARRSRVDSFQIEPG